MSAPITRPPASRGATQSDPPDGREVLGISGGGDQHGVVHARVQLGAPRAQDARHARGGVGLGRVALAQLAGPRQALGIDVGHDRGAGEQEGQPSDHVAAGGEGHLHARRLDERGDEQRRDDQDGDR